MKHINLRLTTLLQNVPNIKHDKQVCFFQFDKDIQVSLPKVAIARFGIGNVNEYIRFSYCFNRDFTSSTIFSACRQLITYFSLLFILIKRLDYNLLHMLYKTLFYYYRIFLYTHLIHLCLKYEFLLHFPYGIRKYQLYRNRDIHLPQYTFHNYMRF